MATGDRHRDRAAGLALPAACGTLLAVAGLVVYAWLARPPTRAEAARLVAPGTLLAYSPADRHHPRVLSAEGDRLRFDALRLDWRPLLSGHRPVWRVSGRAVGIPRSAAPASVTAVPCIGQGGTACGVIDLVGEVVDPTIASVEVAVDGAWRRYGVDDGGFFVSLAAYQRIGDARWLRRDGTVVWFVDRDGDGQRSGRR